MSFEARFAGPPDRLPAVVRVAIGSQAVRALLFLTILSSAVVFREPAPYEGLVLLLGLAYLLSGTLPDRRLVPLAFVLLLWAAGGCWAVVPLADNRDAVTYWLTSCYLQASALLFACLLAEETMPRLSALKSGYMLAALIAALLGTVGYFTGSELLTENTRARATFKDPNVFGPFLVLPVLLLMLQAFQRGVRMRDAGAGAVILSGLFLTFSRGAWAHLVGSALLMVVLTVATTRSARSRLRIVLLGAFAAVGILALVPAMLSIQSVGELFAERASLTQSYDVQRFGWQATAIDLIIEHPRGIGPKQFGKHFKQDPHNVYINAFLSYGWIGGFAYLSVILLTLATGFRALLVETPWQPYLVAVYSTFACLSLEGLVIDTDHWRHFFLLLGLTWGLVIATERARQSGFGSYSAG